jgi:hypothetical protein
MRSTSRSLLLVCKTFSHDVVNLFNMPDVVLCRGWEATLLVMVDASERQIGFDLHQITLATEDGSLYGRRHKNIADWTDLANTGWILGDEVPGCNIAVFVRAPGGD